MLILSRKQEEQIVIETGQGERIELTVCNIGEGKVRLGFEAPRDITIVRSEVEQAR